MDIRYATYEEVLKRVEAGEMVAIAPIYGTEGERDRLICIVGELQPQSKAAVLHATKTQRAHLALQAVRQARKHFGFDC